MELDFDTFLVALYTFVDDLYREHCAPQKSQRPGHKPELTDSEVVTLVILAQWLGGRERKMGRYAAKHWRSYFPRLLSQSAFNRRARDVSGCLVHLVPLVAKALKAYLSPYQVLDAVPVPLARRCRGQHHRLFADEASIGKGGADRSWYYGCQLWLAVTADGLITGFVLAPAVTEGRWAADALLCWRQDPLAKPWTPADLPKGYRWYSHYTGATGPIWPRDGVGELSPAPYLADGGLTGEAWIRHWFQDYRAAVITKFDFRGEQVWEAQRQHCSRRQVIETVNSHLEADFALHFPGAKTRWGLLVRIAAKLLAFNLGIWLNRLFGRNDFALATLFDS